MDFGFWKPLIEENRRTGAFSYRKKKKKKKSSSPPASWLDHKCAAWPGRVISALWWPSAFKTRWLAGDWEGLGRGPPGGLGNSGGMNKLLPWAIFNVLHLIQFAYSFHSLGKKPGKFRNARCHRNQLTTSPARMEMTEVGCTGMAASVRRKSMALEH